MKTTNINGVELTENILKFLREQQSDNEATLTVWLDKLADMVGFLAFIAKGEHRSEDQEKAMDYLLDLSALRDELKLLKIK
ncbi:MAG: hypothetical protein Q4A09_04985 [Capnocytophaga felis]|nr:hypothetical protein [Capnocytophaga felis]